MTVNHPAALAIGGAPLPKRESNKIAKQIAIYDAAMTLFTERSYDAVSVDEICEKAGVGRATFFRLFRNKAGLIEEFNRRVALVIEQTVRLNEATGIEALRLTSQVIQREWSNNQPLMHDLVAEYVRSLDQLYDLNNPKIEATYYGGRAISELVIRQIVQGQLRGEIRPNLDPIFMGVIFVSQLGAAFMIWVGQSDTSLKSFRSKIDQITEVALRGMAV